MEHCSEQSLAEAIEKCQNIDNYRVLIVMSTWKRADYWSQYIADKYGFAFKHISKNKFICANSSTVRLVSESRNMNGFMADLILYDREISYEAFVALEFIEMRGKGQL